MNIRVDARKTLREMVVGEPTSGRFLSQITSDQYRDYLLDAYLECKEYDYLVSPEYTPKSIESSWFPEVVVEC